MHPHRRIFQFLLRYKYQVIFPIAVVEGPIVTVISGILVARGRLSFLPTLAVVFAGDMVSDPALYMLGRFGRHLMHKLPFIRIPAERLKQLERQFEQNPWKTMVVGKLSYGLGTLFVLAAGAARMPARKFLKYMATVDAVKSTLLLLLGFFFGRAILHLSGYLQYYAIAVIVLVPLLGWLLRKGRAK